MAESSSRTETKLRIPFPSASNAQVEIVGILSQHTPFPSSSSASSSSSSSSDNGQQSRPLALMLHGVLAHKDQSYHKELAKRLPIDSFRFDFRANGETPGEWDMANFEADVEDLNCIIPYLNAEYGYVVDVVVGHSRGSLSGWQWFAATYHSLSLPSSSSSSSKPNKDRSLIPGAPETPPCWISLGGRWRMERIHDRDHLYLPAFEKEGHYTWKAKVAGKDMSVKIYPDQVKTFEEYPIADLVSRFPAAADTLLIHGTADKTVPCADVAYYLNALVSRSDRTPGQTQLHLVEEADHMFRGNYDQVVDVVTQWYLSRRPQRQQRQSREGSEGGDPSSSGKDLALEAKQQGDVLERSWREKSTFNGQNKL